MITLSVEDSRAEENRITELMNEIDPAGLHSVESDPEQVVDFVVQKSPDIVWLNPDIPGLNVIELAEKIINVSPQTNIIFVAESAEYTVEAFRLHASGYMIKPVSKEAMESEIENLRYPARSREKSRLYIQCFGKFEVYSNDRIMRFGRSKSKEALAYMIDRRGSGCTVSEICSILWENRLVDSKLKGQCRVILADLKKDLKRVGADDILIKMWNLWSVDVRKFGCDYYSFLKKEKDADDIFRGEYMAQYSWAEMTTGNLFEMTNNEEK